MTQEGPQQKAQEPARKRQSLAQKAFSEIGRISRDHIPGFIEKFETARIPHAIERRISDTEAEGFAASLITPEQRQTLDALIRELPDGLYRSREVAGSEEDGNKHPHDFVIDKKGPSAKLFFIDPEHAMGKNKNRGFLPRVGDLRPQVNVFYGAELIEGDPTPRLALLRYRGAAIAEQDKHLHKPAAQLQMAREMLESGELPEALSGKENHVTFRLDLRPTDEGSEYTVFVQARAARAEGDLEQMVARSIEGRPLSTHDPLEGQLRRFRAIMRTHFPNHLRAGGFKLIEES